MKDLSQYIWESLLDDDLEDVSDVVVSKANSIGAKYIIKNVSRYDLHKLFSKPALSKIKTHYNLNKDDFMMFNETGITLSQRMIPKAPDPISLLIANIILSTDLSLLEKNQETLSKLESLLISALKRDIEKDMEVIIERKSRRVTDNGSLKAVIGVCAHSNGKMSEYRLWEK